LVAEAPGVELAAVVDPDPEARRNVEVTPGYGVLEEALEAVECDAVLVASPPGTHHVVAKAALEAGKHILC
jgi:predicted dehydrogenase